MSGPGSSKAGLSAFCWWSIWRSASSFPYPSGGDGASGCKRNWPSSRPLQKRRYRRPRPTRRHRPPCRHLLLLLRHRYRRLLPLPRLRLRCRRPLPLPRLRLRCRRLLPLPRLRLRCRRPLPLLQIKRRFPLRLPPHLLNSAPTAANDARKGIGSANSAERI